MTDQYFTNKGIVGRCADMVVGLRPDLIVDFSAGDGAFGDAIRQNDTQSALYEVDMCPLGARRDEIRKSDWFDVRAGDIPGVSEARNVVVGLNLPYGRQNALARRFLEHAADITRCQAMVLVLSAGFHTGYPDAYSVTSEHYLPEASFHRPDGTPFAYAAKIVVLQRRPYGELRPPLPVTSPALANLAIRQHGIITDRTIAVVRRAGVHAGRQVVAVQNAKRVHYLDRHHAVRRIVRKKRAQASAPYTLNIRRKPTATKGRLVIGGSNWLKIDWLGDADDAARPNSTALAQHILQNPPAHIAARAASAHSNVSVNRTHLAAMLSAFQ